MIFTNTILISTLLSMCASQLIKGAFYIIKANRKKALKNIVKEVVWNTGGMPSSHAAVVCALCTSLGFIEGFSSSIFIFSFWFALLTLRDAMGVRRSVGILAAALNNFGKEAARENSTDFHSIKEIQGHTPLEVAVGAILGISISSIIHIHIL